MNDDRRSSNAASRSAERRSILKEGMGRFERMVRLLGPKIEREVNTQTGRGCEIVAIESSSQIVVSGLF
jgi:hypothetical protein